VIGVQIGQTWILSNVIISSVIVSISATCRVEGIDILGGMKGETLTVNGSFSLYSTRSAWGVSLGEGTNCNGISGQPNFYSNEIDSGNWSETTGGNKTEYWNGALTTVGETYDTTADGTLALTPVYDTADNLATNAHFSFLGVSNSQTSPVNSKTEFNNKLIADFSVLANSYIRWSNIVNNINTRI
jgi:hypothetical protein